MKVVRVTRSEFELSDGSVHPIVPELIYDITVEEFQAIYDESYDIVKSIKDARGVNSDT